MFTDICLLLYITRNNFTVLKILCALPIHPFLSPVPATMDLFTVSIVLPFPECYIVGIIHIIVGFCSWLFFHTVKESSRLLHVCIVSFFFLIAGSIPQFIWPFICWRTSGLMPFFWLLWIKLLGMFMHRFLCDCKFSFLWDKSLGAQLLDCMIV